MTEARDVDVERRSAPESSESALGHGKARRASGGRNVVISGLGVVSALGQSPQAFWGGLLAGRCGIGRLTAREPHGPGPAIGAEVTNFDITRYALPNRSARRWPRPVQFALAAGMQALTDSGFNGRSGADRLGVYVGTSIGNLAAVFDMHAQYRAAGRCQPAFGFSTFHQSIACLVSAALDCRGPSHTTTSGCNSGLDALGQAARLVAHGDADAMLVIGTDCELVPEVFAALKAAGALATRFDDSPEHASRPFDSDRDGNVLGEGAAALLIESADLAYERRARTYARVAGFANRSAGRNREYRHADPDLDIAPAVRTLQAAIADAGWHPEQVDLVNANGSSSKRYDALEAQAIHAAFGNRGAAHVPVHSVTSGLGQHGAGSTAFQAVAACLPLTIGLVPPTGNCARLAPR